MSLFNKFKDGLRGRNDPLAELAGEPEGSEVFIEALATHGVWVIGNNLDSEAGSIDFVEHTEGDKSYFPVFSSQDAAAQFVQQLALDEVTAFSCFGGSPAVLLDNDFEAVVLNPTTPSERKISQTEIAALRILCGNEKNSDDSAI
jgi:hypothetical protein